MRPKRFVTLWLFAVVLVASASQAKTGHFVPADVRLNQPDEAVARDGGDTSVRPGDDFYRYVNGKWLDATPMPADHTDIGTLQQAIDRTDAQLRGLMQDAAATRDSPPSSIAAKVGAYYRAWLDQPRRDALGWQPVKPALEAIKAANTHDAQAALMGQAPDGLQATLFGLTVDVDQGDPTHHAAVMTLAGMAMPDRAYYLDKAFAAQRAAYLSYLESIFAAVGWPDPSGCARKVLAFETAIARLSWTQAQQRDVLAGYNRVSLNDLAQTAPGFPWDAYLHAARVPAGAHLVVVEKPAFTHVAALFAATPVATLQAWQVAHVLDHASPLLSSGFSAAYFRFRGKALAGRAAEMPPWQQAVHAIAGSGCPGDTSVCFGSLRWSVGQLYVARYFPPASRDAVRRMIVELREAFVARMQALAWMSPGTRAEGLRKLAAYTVKIGYPDHWPIDAPAVVRDDDLVGDTLAAARVDWTDQLARLMLPVDPTQWDEAPQTVDANNGTALDIEFPAALLQPPLFDPGADAAANYGSLGPFIGHEWTHGFDDDGRHMDSANRLRDWWSAGDAAQFNRRAKALGAQYATVELLPGVHIDSAQTMGENIADLGGVVLALDAYHRSLGGKVAPVLDGLTGDQRYFLAWARLWRGKKTAAALRDQLADDVHSPYPARVNIVFRNIDAWYAAFGVVPGQALYLPPGKRVQIW